MGPPRTAVDDQVDAAAQDTALLSAADCDFIKEFQDSLSTEAANGRDCGGLLTAILRHLGRFKERIQADSAGNDDDQQEYSSVALSPLPGVWGPVTAEAHMSHGEHKVSINGPGPDDHFQVPASSPDDASRTVSLQLPNAWSMYSSPYFLMADSQITFVAGVDAAVSVYWASQV